MSVVNLPFSDIDANACPPIAVQPTSDHNANRKYDTAVISQNYSVFYKTFEISSPVIIQRVVIDCSSADKLSHAKAECVHKHKQPHQKYLVKILHFPIKKAF